MTAPRLLEPFAGAGGSAHGYELAGFDVTSVDNDPALLNVHPGSLTICDAFEYLAEYGREFNPIHVGPPCQGYSTTRSLHSVKYPRWIAPLRIILDHIGKPYVIENVVGARSAMRNPVMLCGSSFSLGVRRHRLFETNWPVGMVPPCAHYLQPEPIDVTGTGARRKGERMDGRGGNSRKPRNIAEARAAMGIDWMSREQLSEAVPPPFTQYLGEHLLEYLRAAA